MINHLETDLIKIGQLGKKHEKENTNFRMFLKGEDSSKIDRIVQLINKEISAKIDCTECGNCCKSLHPSLTKNEIERLSEIKNMSQKSFVLKYVEKDPFDSDQYLKHIPCVFLNNKFCRIYEQRPEICRSYPHLHKPGFTSRSLGVMTNYSVCPIVFNVVEALKRKLNYMN